MHKAAAVVNVELYSAWESTATLRLLGSAQGSSAPTEEREWWGILCRHAHSLFNILAVDITALCTTDSVSAGVIIPQVASSDFDVGPLLC